jgi:ABC-type glycerol-3-phosphate transport system substrate-binding protein
MASVGASAGASMLIKSVVILDKPSDWDEWLYSVKRIARNAKITDLVGLGAAGPIPQFKEPQEPSYGDVNSEATLLTHLNRDQADLYKILRDEYKTKLLAYKEKQKSMEELEKHIEITISR